MTSSCVSYLYNFLLSAKRIQTRCSVFLVRHALAQTLYLKSFWFLPRRHHDGVLFNRKQTHARQPAPGRTNLRKPTADKSQKLHWSKNKLIKLIKKSFHYHMHLPIIPPFQKTNETKQKENMQQVGEMESGRKVEEEVLCLHDYTTSREPKQA